MSESLAARVGRIVSATAHAPLEAVEDVAPEQVIEEAIREVDGAIDDVRAELGKVLAKQHMAAKRLSAESQRHDDLSEKIRIALSEGREDIAEAGIGQLLDIEAQIPVLEATVADTRKTQTQFEGFVSALQARKRGMMDEFAAFRADMGVLGNKAGAALRRAETAYDKAVEGAGGVAGSMSLPTPEIAALKSELDDLARANRIKESLEALKAK